MALRVDPEGVVGKRLIALGAWLAQGLIRLLGRTCRLEVVAGEEHVEARLAAGDGEPARRATIYVFWHDRTILAGPYFRLLARRGVDVAVLASQSRDGELVGRVVRRWKLRLVRGSASRGGSRALRVLYRLITREGASPVLLPDGPRGPRHRFKLGVAVLAQMSGAPILPLGFAVSRAWRLGSWDRMFVPKPFARVVLVIGPPQVVPRELAGDALEAERRRLEELLDELGRRAETALETTAEG